MELRWCRVWKSGEMFNLSTVELGSQFSGCSIPTCVSSNRSSFDISLIKPFAERTECCADTIEKAKRKTFKEWGTEFCVNLISHTSYVRSTSKFRILQSNKVSISLALYMCSANSIMLMLLLLRWRFHYAKNIFILFLFIRELVLHLVEDWLATLCFAGKMEMWFWEVKWWWLTRTW